MKTLNFKRVKKSYILKNPTGNINLVGLKTSMNVRGITLKRQNILGVLP